MLVSAGSSRDAFCASGPAFSLASGSPLWFQTPGCDSNLPFSVSQKPPWAGTVSHFVLALKAGLWGALAASTSSKACKQQGFQEPPGTQTHLNPSSSLPQRGHAGLGSPVPPPRHIHGRWEGQLLQLHSARPQPGKQFQSEGIPHPSPPAIAAAS